MFPSTNSSQRQEWMLWNLCVLQKQESAYRPGTNSLPCSSMLILPPTSHLASLIMKNEPSVIRFRPPIPNSNPEAWDFELCLPKDVGPQSSVQLAVPSPSLTTCEAPVQNIYTAWNQQNTSVITPVSCFSSQRYPHTLTETHSLILKNKATHIMVMGKRPLLCLYVCSDRVHITTLPFANTCFF